MPLQLTTIAKPGQPNARITGFSDYRSAIQHIGDHVLSDPERLVWKIIEPKLEDDNLFQIPAVDRVNREAQRTQGECLQTIYGLMMQAVDAEAEYATAHRWYAKSCRDQEITVAMGLQGIYMAVGGDSLLSAYIPGQGSAEAVIGSQADDALGHPKNLLRRKRGAVNRTNYHDRGDCDVNNRDSSQDQAINSEENMLYYKAFRPAVEHIFNSKEGTDYAVLKEILPFKRRSDYKIAVWHELRRQQRD